MFVQALCLSEIHHFHGSHDGSVSRISLRSVVFILATFSQIFMVDLFLAKSCHAYMFLLAEAP